VIDEHRFNDATRLPGRKAGKLSFGIRNGDAAHVDMRIDAKAGKFIAVLGNVYYAADSKDELKKHVRAVVEAQLQIEWTRYIEVEYEAQGVGEWSARSTLDQKREEPTIDEDGQMRGPCCINLQWEVYDYSQMIRPPGYAEPRRKRRRVYSDFDVHGPDGSYHTEEWLHDSKMPPNVIPYTAARLRALVEVQLAIARADYRIWELLRGGAERMAQQLDGVAALCAPPVVLAFPEPPKTTGGARSKKR